VAITGIFDIITIINIVLIWFVS